MPDVRFLDEAAIDFREAREWYERRSPPASAGFSAAAEVALQRIARSPETWPHCDERHRYYTLKRYPYAVVYRIESEFILIVAIAHARRADAFWRSRVQDLE